MDPASEITSIPNFRDVGKTVNDFLGRRLLKEGLFYRSARLDDATLEDRDRLKDQVGLKTVVDLRTKTEHLKQARKRQADLEIPALLQSNAALAAPLQIPGVKYHEIRITGRPFEIYLLRQLSWWNILKVIFFFLFGFRIPAIRILGREVMLPRGLVGLGLDTLDQSGREIAESLKAFLEPSALPLLVHCAQGKDRTGLVVSLVLMILGVPLEAIDEDYKLTDEALVAERDERLVEIREIGLTEDFATTAKDMIVQTERHLQDRYGGLDNYLDLIGFGDPDRIRLRALLMS